MLICKLNIDLEVIEFGEYGEFAYDYETKKLTKPNPTKFSNLIEFLREVDIFVFCDNFEGYWTYFEGLTINPLKKSNGDLPQKKKIQSLVFPSGIGYDKLKGKVQTKRVNSILSSIPLLSVDLAKIKSGEPVNFNQFSARVTSTGFKPYT